MKKLNQIVEGLLCSFSLDELSEKEYMEEQIILMAAGNKEFERKVFAIGMNAIVKQCRKIANRKREMIKEFYKQELKKGG